MTFTFRPGLDVSFVLDHIGWGYGYVRKKGSPVVIQIGDTKLHLMEVRQGA